MGARHTEVGLGLWLLVSPFVFAHAGQTGLLVHDLLLGTLVMTIALLCYHPRARRLHLALLAVGGWLAAFGWWAALDGADAASQNHVVVGLLLMMTSIVPARAGVPPTGWRAWRSGVERAPQQPVAPAPSRPESPA